MVAYSIANTTNLNPNLSNWTEIMAKTTSPNPNIPESTDPGTSSDEEEEETTNENNSYVQHKDCTILSVPFFDFDSTDEEQESKCTPSRDQEIIKQ